MVRYSEKGFAHILILLAALGLIAFLVISNSAFFKDKLFATLFSKPFSHASGDSFTADIVFGQVNDGQTSPNQITGNRLFYPQGVVVDRSTTPNRVYVWDNGNSRILGFRSTNLETENADIVIGQPDFFQGACNHNNNIYGQASATSLCGMNYPYVASILESQSGSQLAVDSNHNLYVNDMWNHRVLKFDDPFATDQVADFVWGQDDFSSRICNQGRDAGSPSQRSICNSPISQVGGDHLGTGVDVDADGNVWAVDGANNRILRFPPNSKDANLVIGQPNFTTNDSRACGSSSPSSSYLCAPKSVRFDSRTNTLYVVDWPIPGAPYVARVLIYNGDLSDGMAASEVLTGDTTGNYSYKFFRPQGLTLDPNLTNAFWLADSNHHRVLLFQKVDDSWTIKKVVGQPDLNKVSQGGFENLCSIHTGPPYMCQLNSPAGGIGIDSEGNIYGGDLKQNQIMRFPYPPDVSDLGGAPVTANKIYLQSQGGYPNLVSGSGMGPSNGAILVNYPTGQKQLLIGDINRLLFWNNYSEKTSGSSADGVVFHSSLSSYPSGDIILSLENDNSGRIWVAKNSDPIYVFQGPLTNNQQPNFTLPKTLPLRFGGTISINNITGLAYDDSKDVLWIADSSAHRVIRLNHPLDSSTREVDMVLGQPSLTSVSPNRGKDPAGTLQCPSTSADSFARLGMIALDNFGNLYIVDATHEGWQCSNNRIVEYDTADLVPSPTTNFFADGEKTAKRVYGPPNFTTKSATTPDTQPHIPMGMTFNSNNKMLVVADAYGNPSQKRVFGYNNPLTCTNPATAPCSVAATSVFPVVGSQLAHPSFDKDGNLAILDHTWNRLLYFNQPTWFGQEEPSPSVIASIQPSPSPSITPRPSPSASTDSVAPEVVITRPLNNAKVNKNSQQIIQANATDNVGVIRVEFYSNNSLLNTDTSKPYSYTWKVPGTSNTTYNLMVKAYDVAGNSSSATIKVSTGK